MNKYRKCRRCGGMDERIYTTDGVDQWYCGDCKSERREDFLALETSETRAIDEIGE